MNFRERRRYWLQAARQMRRLELTYASKIQALLKEQVSSLILNAEEVGFNAAIGSAPLFNDRRLPLRWRRRGLFSTQGR
jgi:hypothetical protein